MAYNYEFDPVMTGFEQPSTMSPRGQLEAYKGQRKGYATPGVPRVPTIGAGEIEYQPQLAGAGVVGPVVTAARAAEIPFAATALVGSAAYLSATELGNGVAEEGMPDVWHGVPFGGPFLKEPGGRYLLKEWHIRCDSKEGDFDLQFYLTINDRGTKRIFMYNQRTKAWKTWPMPRLAVIGKNMPSHKMITRLRRNLKRHTADAVTILKLTAPNKLESTRRPGGRWVAGRKRYID